MVEGGRGRGSNGRREERVEGRRRERGEGKRGWKGGGEGRREERVEGGRGRREERVEGGRGKGEKGGEGGRMGELTPPCMSHYNGLTHVEVSVLGMEDFLMSRSGLTDALKRQK